MGLARSRATSTLRGSHPAENGGMAELTDIRRLAHRDGRFDPEAFSLVGQGLCHAARLLGKDEAKDDDRHLTARELVTGLVDLAAERYGLLAEPVLRAWGIREAADIGQITFLLIAHGVFTKQPSDRFEDFLDLPALGPALAARVRWRLGRGRGDP